MTRRNTQALLLALTIFPLATGAAADAPAPALKSGDFWVYRVSDGFSGDTRGTERRAVTAVDGGKVRIDVSDAKGASTRQLVVGPDLSLIGSPIPDSPYLEFDPPLPAFDFPLADGKSWTREVRARNTVTGERYERVQVRAKVVGIERIRVPAGEFETYKVRREIYLNDRNAQKSGTHILEYEWFSPKTGSVVRREDQSKYWPVASGGDYGIIHLGDRTILELVEFGASASR